MLRPASHTPRTLLVVIAFLLLIPLLLAQPTPLGADDYVPNDRPLEPADMLYQPPAEAETFAELMAPESLLDSMSAPIAFPEQTPEQVTFTETLPITATVLTTIEIQKDSAVSINNDQVGVFIESETFTQTTDLQFTLLAVAPADPITPTLPAGFPSDTNLYESQKTYLAFQLEALDATTSEPIETFNQEVRLAIDVRNLGYTFPDHGVFFLAYQSEEDPNEWIDVPLTVYEPGFYSADVPHFSDWATGWRPDGWTLNWSPPSADGFSGASTYAYPFQLPPGRNGLQPSLALSYSNSALNGAIRRVSGGTVATGWSLSEISIVRTGVKMAGLSNLEMPNKFRLVLNGTGYKLTATTETINGGTRYTADNGPQLFILKYANPTYWVVITGEGTQYRLGSTDDSQTWHLLYLNPATFPDPIDDGVIEWHVDTVTDTSGNQITYHYDNSLVTDSEGFMSWCPWPEGGVCVSQLQTKASRLTDIYYNFKTRIGDQVGTLPPTNQVARLNSSDAATRIHLEYKMPGSRFSNLLIYHNSTNPMREYVVSSEDWSEENPRSGCKDGSDTIFSHTVVVTSITEYGWNQATGSRYNLPPTTFDYVALRNYTHDNQPCFIYNHLRLVTNGYGGEVEFTYASDDRSVGGFVNDGNTVLEYPTVGYSHYVVKVDQRDGRGHTSTITYDRQGICYNQQFGTNGCAADDDAPEWGILAGFNTVKTYYYKLDGTTLERQEETLYHTIQNKHGRPFQQDVKDSNGDVRQSTHTEYRTDMGTFHPVESVTTTWYVDGLASTSMSNKVTYDYVPGDQGGTQYGNLTHVREYADADATTPYRITRRWYEPSTSITDNNNQWYWLVTALEKEAVYSNENGAPLTVQYLYYDSHSYGETPTQGRVTKVRQGDPTTPCGPESGCSYARKTIDTIYSYDSFGNLLTTATYTGYGYLSFYSNGDVRLDTAPTGPTRTTTLVYDLDYRLYPVQVTDPGEYVTKFDVYGFKNWNQTLVSVDGFSRQTGLLKQVTGANGLFTLYEYDPFGRLTNVYDSTGDRSTLTDPWDGNPLTRYQYFDNGWQGSQQTDPANNKPFPIVVRQRPGTYHTGTGGTGYEFKQVTYYDGLGRPIQSQDRWVAVDGLTNRQDRIVTTDYDAWGRTTCTTTPYTVDTYTVRTGGVGSGFLTSSCTTLTHTTAQYDELGRPVSVTDPASISTSYTYTIESIVTVDGYTRLSHTNVTDANSHITGQFTNSLGQLVLVREYGDTNHEADTRYTYDLFGNLTAVGTSTLRNTQPAVNEFLRRTTMTYDAFGRKTGMTDPDMGAWSYIYDAASNLTQQEDAKDQVLCFTYDALDRILTKAEDYPANGCNNGNVTLATYSYFGPNNGVSTGQVAEIRWPDASNRETFSYNSKGLLETHTRWIDERNYSLSYYDYDLLNRPTTLVYPNDEAATISYDREGENSLSASITRYAQAVTLVSQLKYNDQGQMTLVDRSSFDTQYDYYPLTGGTAGNNNGRLETIRHGSQNDVLPDFDYLYDEVGNIEELVTKVKPGSSQLTDTQNFSYDERNRLLTASGSGSIPEMPTYSQAYVYDRLGNIDVRQEKTCNPICGPVWNVYDYSYGSKPQAVTTVGGQGSYNYDANGNMTSRTEGSTTYTQYYDAENRLVSVMAAGSSTTFAYDASGQRVKTTSTPTSNNRTITYYPFPNYEEELQETWQAGACEETCPGAWVTDTTITRSLYSLAGQVIATRVVSNPAESTDGLFYFLGDHLGSTRLLTNTSGGVVNGTTAHFLPYGSYRGSEPAGAITDKGFTGHKHNDDLGLIYMNARYFVQGIGRFANADAIVPGHTDPQAFNRYTYVLGNSLRFTDPSGHGPCDENGNCQSQPYKSSMFPSAIKNHFIDFDEVTGLQPFGATLFALDNQSYAEYCANYHCGIDFFAPEGTEVRAGVHGEVTQINCPSDILGPCNVVVEFRDEKNQVVYKIFYGHLGTVSEELYVGASVNPYTKIGTVGDYPEPDTPDHVHIEISDLHQTTWYNPLQFYTPILRNEYLELTDAFQNNQTFLVNYPESLKFWEGLTVAGQPPYICYNGRPAGENSCQR